MRIYTLQAFTGADGASYQAGQTYTVADYVGFNAFQKGQAQPADTQPGFGFALSPVPQTQSPYILDQSAVPVILPSSGSSNATGQITLTTALPYTPSGTVKIYLPSGVVTAGSAGTGAGLYSVVFSSTTVCQIQGTGIVTANGAYTQTTAADITLANTTVPGGAMGANGALRTFVGLSVPNNANNKPFKHQFGGSVYGGSSIVLTSASGAELGRILRNRGVQNSQVSMGLSNIGSFAGAAITFTAVDSSVSQNLAFTGNLAVATDYIILEGYTVEVLPKS